MMVNYSTYWEYYNYLFPIKIILGLIEVLLFTAGLEN
jgi:hypothetical protein